MVCVVGCVVGHVDMDTEVFVAWVGCFGVCEYA